MTLYQTLLTLAGMALLVALTILTSTFEGEDYDQ
jgi:hypothetical protein